MLAALTKHLDSLVWRIDRPILFLPPTNDWAPEFTSEPSIDFVWSVA
jgi:hypothetical protein